MVPMLSHSASVRGRGWGSLGVFPMDRWTGGAVGGGGGGDRDGGEDEGDGDGDDDSRQEQQQEKDQ